MKLKQLEWKTCNNKWLQLKSGLQPFDIFGGGDKMIADCCI